jgi:hypothetical protein
MPKKKKKGKRRQRRGIDFDRAKKDKAELASRSAGNFHKLEEGWNTFYIGPPWDDDIPVPWKEVQQHGLGLVCPKHSGYDKDCKICKKRKEAQKRGDTDFADAFKLSSRGFMNALRKGDIKKGGPWKVLGVAGSVLGEIVDHVVDDKVDITRPEAAVLVSIKRKGTGQATRYPQIKFSNPTDLSDYLGEEMYEQLEDLDCIQAVQPATTEKQLEAIRKKVSGSDDDADFDIEDDDIDPDDFSSDEEDDEDEDGEEDDLFDDPEDDDDLDEDEDEEDEEEEEKPKRKRRKVKADVKKGRKKDKKGSAKGKKKKKRK